MRLLVITPTLGRSTFLEQTRASLEEVTVEIRHLLVCPLSEVEVLRSRFPLCEVVPDAGSDGGLYGALNAGLAAAGEDWDWFTYINDDDLLGRDFGRCAGAHMKAGDDGIVGYGDVSLVDEAGRRLGLMSVERDAGRFVPLLDAGVSPISQQGMLFSRRLVRELGGYHPQWRLCGDQDFWVRALRAGFGFRHQGGEVGVFRIRRGQLSGDVTSVRAEMAAITRAHFPEKTSGDVSARARRLFRARNSLRLVTRALRSGVKSNAALLSSEHVQSVKRPPRAILINGLGCLEAGSRGVLRELIRHVPKGKKAWLILPSANRADLGGLSRDVRVLALNHRVFGRWLRPLFEAGLYLFTASGIFSRVVNLSNYGWCAPRETPTVLYCHNALLVEDGHDQWSGEGGRPNWFKRWCLDSCMRRAEKIIVQTEHMGARMEAYAQRRELKPAKIEVVRPLPDFSCPAAPAERIFPFQFFYPASVFPHKRVMLAMHAAIEAHRHDPRIGLVITCPAEVGQRASCIRAMGPISHDAVMAHFAASDALLFTSNLETLALPLLEAMHYRLPAVLPSLPYGRDIYADAGVYFRSDDVAAVAEAMLMCVREYDECRARVAVRREQEWPRRTSWSEHWRTMGVV